jgi:hypothetical protein
LLKSLEEMVKIKKQQTKQGDRSAGWHLKNHIPLV